MTVLVVEPRRFSRASAETWYIRDALRDALPTRIPRTGPELFERVTSEYGHIDVRRLWRQLAWLLERGIARRVGGRRATTTEERGYVRGNGTETAVDAEARRACELSGDGRCVVCSRRLSKPHPRWMAWRCADCHWRRRVEDSKAVRDARIANGECARCGKEPRPGLKECARCARVQARAQKALRDRRAERTGEAAASGHARRTA